MGKRLGFFSGIVSQVPADGKAIELHYSGSVRVSMPGETFVVPITPTRRFLHEAGPHAASGRPGKGEDQND